MVNEQHSDPCPPATAGRGDAPGLKWAKARPFHSLWLVALALCVMWSEAAGATSTFVPASPPDVVVPQATGTQSGRVASNQPLEIETALDVLARRLVAGLPLVATRDRFSIRIDVISLEGRQRVPDGSLAANQDLRDPLAAVTETQDILGVFIETALAAKLLSTGVVALVPDAASHVTGSYWLGGPGTILIRVHLVNDQGHTVAAASQAVQAVTIAERYVRHVNQLRADPVFPSLAQEDPSLVAVNPSPALIPAAWLDNNGRAPVLHGPPPPVPPAMVARDEQGRVTLRAVRLEEPLRLDGRLDEGTYAAVPGVGDFVQQDPDEGEPPTQPTEIWVFFDDTTFYFSARCWDSEPERIVAKEMRRGNVGVARDDSITLTLDTFYDRRNGYYFETNTLGGLYDALVTDERAENFDWDTAWETKSARFEGGWTLEMAIPFKSLRYSQGGPQIWGINVRRKLIRYEEISLLSPIPASYGRVGIWKFSSAATLVGLETPARSVNLELKPYGISTVATDYAATPITGNVLTGDAGLDIKYGLTKGLTADLTYNTDFAQVEVDEMQVNLTRFGLFFPEKRSFFLEGRDIFAFGGAGPRFSGLPAGDAPLLFFSRQIGLNEGRAIPILGGGRVTGRAGPYSIGLLNVRTDKDPEGVVQPTNFSVVRLKRDILDRSTVGVIGTHRSEALNSPGENSVYGLDTRLAFFSNLLIDAYYAKTRTQGRTGNDTSYRTRVENVGDRYGFALEHLQVERNFNPEIGFMRRQDFRRSFGQASFSPRHLASDLVRKYTLQASIEYITSDSTGMLETREAIARFDIQFENGEKWRTHYSRQFEFLTEPFTIAEGVVIPVGGYHFETVQSRYTLGSQRLFAGNLGFQTGTFFGGKRSEVSYSGRVALGTHVGFEPSLAVNLIDLPQGRFETQIGRLRLTLMMTPRMFVEAFSQYSSATDSVGTNVRYRWEYQPGSDLYVVYTEARNTLVGGFPTLVNRGFAIKLTRQIRF